MRSVFLSYSIEGAGLAAKLDGDLKAAGASVVRSQRRLQTDSDTREQILAEIAKAELCIVVAVSDEAASDPWVAYQIGLASGAGKQVVLLTTSDTTVAHAAIPFDAAEVMAVPAGFEPRRSVNALAEPAVEAGAIADAAGDEEEETAPEGAKADEGSQTASHASAQSPQEDARGAGRKNHSTSRPKTRSGALGFAARLLGLQGGPARDRPH